MNFCPRFPYLLNVRGEIRYRRFHALFRSAIVNLLTTPVQFIDNTGTIY